MKNKQNKNPFELLRKGKISKEEAREMVWNKFIEKIKDKKYEE